MSVWVRRVVIALVALVLILAAAAAWLVSQFDANRYKGVAIDWMKANRNRTLVIDGPIHLSVFPRLEVRLSKITLSEAGRADTFAALDEAALAVNMLPLLRGELVVGRVEARGVSATLLRDAKGRRNTDDLVQPGPAPPESAPSQPLRLDVSRIALADVRARVKDEPAGIDGELLLKELSTGRVASGVESNVKLDVQFGFKTPALKGALAGSAKITPDFETRSVRLAGMALSYKGDAPGASGIDATVKGALDWDGAKGALDAKGLEMRVTADTAGLKLVDSTLGVERFALDPSRKAFAIHQLRVRLKGTRADQPLALELDWPELDVSGTALKGSALSGRVSLAGQVPLAMSFKSGAPTGNFDNVRVPGFEARISSEGGTRKVEGQLRSDLRLQPGQKSLVLDKLELQARADEAGLKPLAVNLRGNADASARGASWNLTGALNADAFNTEGSANFAGTTPSVKAQARFDTLDLNALLPPAKAAAGTPAPADTPADLAALRSVNGVFGVRVGSFAFRQYRVTDAKLDATLDAGMLRVNQLQGKVWGGTVDASAFADARASRVTVKATANGVNVNALLKDVAGKDLLEGNGRVSLDVESAGRSVGELRSRLKGNAALQLRDGAIKGINLAKTLRQAKAALTLKKDAAQKASQTEKTDFSELNATFQIDAGVARSRDLDVKSPYLRLGGEGAFDIGKGRVDYTARATVTDTSKGQDGSDLAALRGLTVPVLLTGPFEAIDWKVQWSAVAADAVRNQVEDKLKAKLGLKAPAAASGASAPSVQDKLKDKLKGLFK